MPGMMPCPFPGMDPWLEQSGIWKGLHTRLITALADHLTALLAPRYFVDIEQRTYVMTLSSQEVLEPDAHVIREATTPYTANIEMGVETPDGERKSLGMSVWVTLPEVEVIERFLEVRKPKSSEVISVIEILSPTNKRAGVGRTQYEEKRLQIILSQTHLIEIDLLREGKPMFYAGPAESYHSAYRILVSRSTTRPRAELYPFGIREPILNFTLPLLPGDIEPSIELTPILHSIYERARYDMVIDYTTPPEPPLSKDDAAWAAEWLQQRKEKAP